MSDAVDPGATFGTPASLAGFTKAKARATAATPVKVLHMFKYFRPDFTGDGIYFEKLIPLLERRGIRNDVTAEITRADSGNGGKTTARLFGCGRMAAFNPLLLLWFLVNAWRYDVVHMHSAIDRYFVYHMIARFFGCRVVQSCTLDDGLGSLVGGYRPAYRNVIRRLCGLIDDVVAISPRLYRDTLTVTAAARTHLIPQGVALPRLDRSDDRAAARARFAFAPDDVVMLFVGGLCPRKDVRFLVENHPTDIPNLQLLLVGPTLDDAYVAGLREAIARSPAAERITLVGYLDDPTPAYRAADAFVFASHAEGCPNVLLEAMAHGLPVISRNLNGTTDSVIDHGSSGVLFGTPEQYRSAVRRLAFNRDERTAMGAAARRSAEIAFDIEVIASRYSALYAKAR